ncbi:MAG: sigma-70 family RNA polymerase sigma factor, partial [Cyclobacteriaceae bacterium]
MNSKNSDQIDDAAILEAFRTGNRQGIMLLYNKYLPVIYGVCLKYLKDRSEAQDATSELFEKFIDSPVPPHIENLKTWLYVVTKNHCLMLLRRKKKGFVDNIPENIMELAEETHPLDKALMKEKELQALKNCLETLKTE